MPFTPATPTSAFEHDKAIKRLEVEAKRLNDRIHAMHFDQFKGLVDTAFFKKMPNQWREEQNLRENAAFLNFLRSKVA